MAGRGGSLPVGVPPSRCSIPDLAVGFRLRFWNLSFYGVVTPGWNEDPFIPKPRRRQQTVACGLRGGPLMNLQQLANRMERLELENRRLKRSRNAIFAIVCIALLIAAMPSQVPEEIRAKAFRVVDENGNIRMDADATSLNFFDATGAARSEISEGRVAFADAGGTILAELTPENLLFAGPDGTLLTEVSHERVAVAMPTGERSGITGQGFFVVDANGVVRSGVFINGLAYVDADGVDRVFAGNIERTDPTTGVVTRFPGVQILDSGGSVVWESFQQR